MATKWCLSSSDDNGVDGAVRWDGEDIAEKTSYSIDYSIELEYAIGIELNKLNSEHFCKYYNLCRYGSTPSEIVIPSLRMERIHGCLFEDRFNDLSTDERYSIIGRTLTIMAIVNEELGISHNDLHTGNIILRDVDVDVQAYIFPDGEVSTALTYGMSPVVIDFGRAFPGKSCTTMKTQMRHTLMGYFPHEKDEFIDAQQLLRSAEGPKRAKMAVNCGLGTYPDFLREVTNMIKCMDASENEIALFAAQIRLPLRKIKRTINLNDAFKKVGSVNLVDLKNLFDGNTHYLKQNYSKNGLKKLRKRCKNVVLAMNNVLFKMAKNASKTKKDLYSTLTVTRARDVARLMMLSVYYRKGMRVRIYDVKNRSSSTLTLSSDQARMLSTGELRLESLT